VPQPAQAQRPPHRPRSLPKREPFHYFAVQVAGGALTVARAGSPPGAGRPVVLAVHGMTSSHMVYRTVARELSSTALRICFLAPDLRGRGRSANLPEPYGIATHIDDLIAVLDHAGAERAIVVGHSIGGDIAARFAADHPERTASLVLLDGGLPVQPETDGADSDQEPDDDEGGEAPGLLRRIEQTLDRLEKTSATVDEYTAYWRYHPSLKSAWDEDIEAYVRTDFVADEGGVRCVVKLMPVLTDLSDLALDGLTRTSVMRVPAPVRLMRAERGVFDDDPVIPLQELEEFVANHPHVSVELVPDVNHYTLLMGGGHGPSRVAATLAAMAAQHNPA
jgi:lipase